MIALLIWSLIMIIGNIITATIGNIVGIAVFNILWIMIFIGLIIVDKIK